MHCNNSVGVTKVVMDEFDDSGERRTAGAITVTC